VVVLSGFELETRRSTVFSFEIARPYVVMFDVCAEGADDAENVAKVCTGSDIELIAGKVKLPSGHYWT
jgi:hypothetical protein